MWKVAHLKMSCSPLPEAEGVMRHRLNLLRQLAKSASIPFAMQSTSKSIGPSG